ncbi:uncharacterized protein LOC142826087 [Pelodiscus sinensis]|uniref:uncharacterized protein LOC142826087 n=1 Tax=Pelodiscus sinensis TaxID=13735 RepID=UPI003F6CC817
MVAVEPLPVLIITACNTSWGTWECPLLAQVDTAVATPVVRPRELEEEEGGDRSTDEEEEMEVAEDSSQTPPSHPSSSQDVFRASSEAGEGLSVGPPASKGPSSPIPPVPRIQGPSQQTRDYHHLLHRHVCAIEHMECSLRNKIGADEEWRERVWGQYIERCDRMYALLGTIAEHMGPAPQHSMARPPPVAPSDVLSPPPTSPLDVPMPRPVAPPQHRHLLVQPASTRHEGQRRPRIHGGGRGLPSHPRGPPSSGFPPSPSSQFRAPTSSLPTVNPLPRVNKSALYKASAFYLLGGEGRVAGRDGDGSGKWGHPCGQRCRGGLLWGLV